MHGLLNDKLAPITHEGGFLECNRDVALNSRLEWQQPIHASRGVSFVRHDITGAFEEALLRLLPLTSVKRALFTYAHEFEMDSFFDNGHLPTEALTPMSVLAEAIGCRALRVSYVVEGLRSFPARIIEIDGPQRTEFLNYIRTISVTYDGSSWSFDANGELQPYEQLIPYTEDREQERFTYLLLERYRRKLGVRAFEEDLSSTISHPPSERRPGDLPLQRVRLG